MVGYSHLFQDFPQSIVIHTVKGLGVVNEAEVDAFLELSNYNNLLKKKVSNFKTFLISEVFELQSLIWLLIW